MSNLVKLCEDKVSEYVSHLVTVSPVVEIDSVVWP